MNFFNKLDKCDVAKHQLWILLAFTLGLRREEIFGLKWQDVNFDENTISIERAIVYVRNTGLLEKDTKSDSSYRKLSAPEDVMYLLLRWKNEVDASFKRRCKSQKIVPLDANPTSADKWVFTKADGSVGHPHAFN
ncbi:site-specific integrase [Pelosinus sp. sgz500959]|uniref:site-specific integrase n=1 Tax=Pelosinus sp. sgz500959 TaxID=3242472 RepID=UPI00366D10CA